MRAHRQAARPSLKLPPKLAKLGLPQNDIAGPGLVHLSDTGVTVLNLMYTDVVDETTRHLFSLVQVTDLDLQHCEKITDAGIRTGTLQGMKQMKKLNLRSQRNIADACLDDLAKLGHLESLGVRSVGITNAGVERLKSKRRCPTPTCFGEDNVISDWDCQPVMMLTCDGGERYTERVYRLPRIRI